MGASIRGAARRIRPAASDEHARARLAELVAAHRDELSGLSRLIQRPAGYLARYVREGVPKRLPDRERQDLARFYGVDECELGAEI